MATLRPPQKVRLLLTAALAAAILGYGWLAGGFSGAYAQLESDATSGGQNQAAGLSILPAIIDHPVNPGKTSGFSVGVTNITQRPLAVTTDVKLLAEIYQQVDDSIRYRYDASSWISPELPDFILKPGQTRAVSFSAEPPADAGPGGHYAKIHFRVVNGAVDRPDSSTLIYPEVSALVLMSVPGEVEETLELKLSRPAILSFNPSRTITVELANTGNIHVIPSGTISFADGTSRMHASLALEPRLVLPGTTTAQSFDWRPAEGGIYTALADISYGTPLSQLRQSSSIFIVLPAWWVVLVVMAAVPITVRFGLNQAAKRVKPKRRVLASDKTD